MKTKKLLLFWMVLGLATLACARFSVFNQDQVVTAVVRVTLPDGDGGTVRLPPGGGHTWDVASGGTYDVQVLPDAEYIALLTDYRDYWGAALADPEEYNSPDLILLALEKVADLQTQIDKLAASGTSCSGAIPYADEQEGELSPDEISVRLIYDSNFSSWRCR